MLFAKFFVDDTYFYLRDNKNIHILDHNGEFIREIKIDYQNINPTFYIDTDNIYLTQKLRFSINLLVFKKRIKYKYIKHKRKNSIQISFFITNSCIFL
jgi:hypothetical protein